MPTVPLVAFDTETALIENGKLAPPIVCLQWDIAGDRAIITKADGGILEFARNMLTMAANGGWFLVGQNTAYDMAVLAAEWPELLPLIFAAYEAGNVHCTKIRDRLLHIAKGNTGPATRQKGYYSMDTIVARRGLPIRVDKKNPWRLRYAELMDVPLAQWPEPAVSYAIEDPTATRLIFEDQHQEAIAFPYTDANGAYTFDAESARQAGFDFGLHLMSCWGLRADAERVETLIQTIDSSLAKIEPQLIKCGIMRENGTKDTKEIQRRVEAALTKAGKHIPTTPTGKVKTDEETIEACQAYDTVLEGVVKHASLKKMRNTFAVKLLAGVTGNIHASLHVLGADTGRTSCSNPNLQNQPRKGGIRECFRPRDGYVYVAADYDSQELRTLAQACLDLCGFSKLAEAYQADPDFDPHSAFAASQMGLTYDEAMALKKQEDGQFAENRQKAKAVNFGLPGGLGVDTFIDYARKSYNSIVTRTEAQALKDAYFRQQPEMKPFFDNAQRVAEIGMLRQLRSNRIRGGVSFCNGANSYFQGLASDVAKTAVFLVAKACYSEPDSPLYGCKPVILIHDEILIEAPENLAHGAAMELQRLMVVAANMWCPDIPARASPVVSRVWSKKAKAVWQDGKLIPWEPPEKKESV